MEQFSELYSPGNSTTEEYSNQSLSRQSQSNISRLSGTNNPKVASVASSGHGSNEKPTSLLTKVTNNAGFGGGNTLEAPTTAAALFQSKHVHKIHRTRIKPQLLSSASVPPSSSSSSKGTNGQHNTQTSSNNNNNSNPNMYHFMHEMNTSLKQVEQKYEQDTDDEEIEHGIIVPLDKNDEDDDENEDEDEDGDYDAA